MLMTLQMIPCEASAPITECAIFVFTLLRCLTGKIYFASLTNRWFLCMLFPLPFIRKKYLNGNEIWNEQGQFCTELSNDLADLDLLGEDSPWDLLVFGIRKFPKKIL